MQVERDIDRTAHIQGIRQTHGMDTEGLAFPLEGEDGYCYTVDGADGDRCSLILCSDPWLGQVSTSRLYVDLPLIWDLRPKGTLPRAPYLISMLSGPPDTCFDGRPLTPGDFVAVKRQGTRCTCRVTWWWSQAP